MPKIITALFHTRAAAENALYQLELSGITQEQVGLVVTDEARSGFFDLEDHSKADRGVAVGAAVGITAGGILAAIIGAGTIVVPGLNLVVAGEIVAGLAGAGLGAATGGIAGGLIGLGIPEHEARLYHDKLHAGRILIAIKPHGQGQIKEIRDILSRTDAYDIAA